MKRLYIGLLAAGIMLQACENRLNMTDVYDGVLGLSTPGYKILQSYDIGQEYKEEIFLQRGGFTSTPTKVNFVIDKQLVDSISIADGKQYKLLPENCYKLLTPSIDINGKERIFKGEVSYNPEAILQACGGEYENTDYILPIRVITSGMPIISERSVEILGFKVSEPIVSIINTGEYDLNLTENPVASVEVGMPFENNWNATIISWVDEGFVKTYNNSKGTFYQLLPPDVYSSDYKVELKPGVSNGIIDYKIDSKKIAPGSYMLPVKIKEIAADVELKKDEDAFSAFKIMKLGERINKTNWAIDSYTTEEVSGEGPGNGKAIHLIDGKSSTFWHSKWYPNNSTVPLPYDIVVDMKKNIEVVQVELLPRGQGSNNPLYVVQFHISSNKSDWEFIGEFPFSNIDNYLVYAVKKATGRYLKLTIPDKGGNGKTVAIRELEVRGVEK